MYQWNLNRLYTSLEDSALTADLNKLDEINQRWANFTASLSNEGNAAELKQMLAIQTEQYQVAMRLMDYLSLRISIVKTYTERIYEILFFVLQYICFGLYL